jgi:hypothetical protein
MTLSTPLINNLQLIGAIDQGQTISTSSMKIVPRKSWITTINRYRHQDSREKTIKFIKETVEQTIHLITEVPLVKNSYLPHLIGAKSGIQNLAYTYRSDPTFGIECGNLVSQINEYLVRLDFDWPFSLPSKHEIESPHWPQTLPSLKLPKELFDELRQELTCHSWLPNEALDASWPDLDFDPLNFGRQPPYFNLSGHSSDDEI